MDLVIDAHVHYLPMPFFRSLKRHISKDKVLRNMYNSGKRFFSENALPEAIIRGMDKDGVDKAFLFPPQVDSIELARELNDHTAKVVAEHPDRFLGFATIPLRGGEEALDEFDRAVKDLGSKGLGEIHPCFYGLSLDSEELRYIFQKAVYLNVPVVVDTFLLIKAYKGFPESVLDFSSHHFGRLIYSGVLEGLSNLKLVVAHLGGGGFIFRHRIVQGARSSGKPYDKYFKQLYFDTSAIHHLLKLALDFIDHSRLLYGSDWPGISRTVMKTIEGESVIKKGKVVVPAIDLKKTDRVKILGENAAHLLKLKN